MADVRRVFENAGFGEVRSLLQSGNLVFDAGEADDAAIETTIEQALFAELGLRTEVIVRCGEAWRAMIAANPFPDEAKADPSHLVAMVLKMAPPASADEALSAAAGPERVHLTEACAYIYYPEGIADSRLIGSVLDRALGVRGTGRNWNTVQKLAVLAGAQP